MADLHLLDTSVLAGW